VVEELTSQKVCKDDDSGRRLMHVLRKCAKTWATLHGN